mmetsp:Transcript_13742/g.29769  ORF Transcript_13742/g.29769 Transcript_13742/m.29769 type:complete len:335 (-) Transcript_13742:656-1660(-)
MPGEPLWPFGWLALRLDVRTSSDPRCSPEPSSVAPLRRAPEGLLNPGSSGCGIPVALGLPTKLWPELLHSAAQACAGPSCAPGGREELPGGSERNELLSSSSCREGIRQPPRSCREGKTCWMLSQTRHWSSQMRQKGLVGGSSMPHLEHWRLSLALKWRLQRILLIRSADEISLEHAAWKEQQNLPTRVRHFQLSIRSSRETSIAFWHVGMLPSLTRFAWRLESPSTSSEPSEPAPELCPLTAVSVYSGSLATSSPIMLGGWLLLVTLSKSLCSLMPIRYLTPEPPLLARTTLKISILTGASHASRRSKWPTEDFDGSSLCSMKLSNLVFSATV